jgi:hypothetical protein
MSSLRSLFILIIFPLSLEKNKREREKGGKIEKLWGKSEE